MKAELVPITDLTPDPANVRTHSSRNLEAVKASLLKFGQQKPIVVSPSGVVIAGNATMQAAQALGWESIAVVRSELTGTEAIAYAIADNRTAELAEWGEDLGSVLQGMRDDPVVDHLSTGFTDEEIDELLEQVEPPLDFKEVDENIDCEHECPKCHYKWSGGS